MKSTEGEQALGKALKRIRQAAGLTQAQVGAVVLWSQSKMQKIEAGQRLTDDDLETLLTHYEATEEIRREIAGLRALAAPGTPAGVTPCGHFLALKEMEKRDDCTEVLAFHREAIPVPLQSDQYILQMYALAGDRTPPIKILDDRNARRAILSRINAPRYQVVLSESSLLRAPGGAEVIRREQAACLLGLLTEHENLSLRILSFDAVVSHVDTDMTMLKFDLDGPNPVVYVPYFRYGKMFRDKAEVAEFENIWTTLYDAALSEEESLKYLNDLAH
jgi:transcriptional regulator with XRE-family HTH domain